MRIIHIISNLGYGGAENMLVKVVNHDTSNEIKILLLTDYSPLKGKITNPNATVIPLLPRNSRNLFAGIISIVKLLKSFKPDIIQSWMYHSELVGLCIKLFFPKVKLFWNIRCSTSEWINLKVRNKIIFSVLKLGYKLVSGIIVNSQKEFNASIALGYPEKKLIFIPNGYEYVEVRDKNNQRDELLLRFNLDKKSVILGMITRNDISKDIVTMLKSVEMLNKEMSNIHLILVGYGFDTRFVEGLKSYSLENHVHIFGTIPDVFNIIWGFDIAVLSSRSESFPNAIAEYMLASLPVVTTNVADVSEIIGDAGFIVETENPFALYEKLKYVISMSGEEKLSIGIKARNRILQNYQIEKICKMYLKVYSDSCTCVL